MARTSAGIQGVSEVKRIRGKKQPLSSAGLHALRDEYARTIEPARAFAAEALTRERNVKAEGSRLKAESPLVNEQSLLAESGY